MASPLLLQRNTAAKSSTDLTNDYIRNTNYLMGLAAAGMITNSISEYLVLIPSSFFFAFPVLAVGQLVMIGNKITALAGYTSRVSELLEMVL